MDQIEGFRMYLGTAEGESLQRMHPPNMTPELFEKFLPYALALDVDSEWAEKFSGVLERAAADLPEVAEVAEAGNVPVNPGFQIASF